MATFKVGQRVKRIGGCARAFYPCAPAEVQGTILKAIESPHHDRELLWKVAFDNGNSWCCVSESLAPLTDPKAEQFIESLKKLAPLDEPVAA
jgi:hypothetical protein